MSTKFAIDIQNNAIEGPECLFTQPCFAMCYLVLRGHNIFCMEKL